MLPLPETSPLLPDRHPQKDLFICDIVDAVPKGDMASMEHPVFSLATKPDMKIRRYESGDSFIEISPSRYGLATIHDRDILIYCISQCMAALNEGRKVHKNIRFKAKDLLVATNRQTSGRGYELLKDAFRRLQGTQIETNIKQGGKEYFKVFSIIESAEIIKETREGRMLDVEVTLSDWVFDAIENNHILTLNRQYFQLRRPLERKLYEIARKHCGNQKKWSISLEKLKEKCGSSSTLKEFKRLISKISLDDGLHFHFPDYAIEIRENLAIFTPKNKRYPFLKAINQKNSLLRTEWKEWVKRKNIKVSDEEAHFKAFCETKRFKEQQSLF